MVEYHNSEAFVKSRVAKFDPNRGMSTLLVLDDQGNVVDTVENAPVQSIRRVEHGLSALQPGTLVVSRHPDHDDDEYDNGQSNRWIKGVIRNWNETKETYQILFDESPFDGVEEEVEFWNVRLIS